MKPYKPYPTFSSLERVLECPSSERLPQSDEDPGEPALRGTSVHTFLQSLSIGIDHQTALEHVPEEHRQLCEAIPVKELPLHLEAEVPFAIDIAAGTCRKLPRAEAFRDYEGANEDEVCGTLDLVGLGEGIAYVGDYKTGRPVTHPTKNPQFLAGALAVSRVYKVPRVKVEAIYIWEEKIWRAGGIVDVLDLAVFFQKLETTLNSLAYLEPGELLKEGTHCRYCPAFSACPLKNELALAMTDGSLQKSVEGWTSLGLIDADNVSDVYHKWQRMKELTNHVGKIIASYVSRNGPIDIGDGQEYSFRQSTRDVLDANIVFTQAVRLWGHDVAKAMVSHATTKKQIDKAIDDYAKVHGLKKAAMRRELLKAVEEAGGLEKKTSRTLRARKAKPSSD